MLSLGYMRDFTLEEWPVVEQEADLTQGFIDATQTVLTFLQQQTESNYKAIWQQYSLIAYNLGFTVEDIIEAYKAKNEKTMSVSVTAINDIISLFEIISL